LFLFGSKRSQELVLLLGSLVLTVADLGGGVDELDLDGLGGRSVGLVQQALSEGNGSLPGSNDAALHHQEVLVHDSVMGETTKRSDVLLVDVSFGGGVVLDSSDRTSSHSVDLLVHLGSVEVT